MFNVWGLSKDNMSNVSKKGAFCPEMISNASFVLVFCAEIGRSEVIILPNPRKFSPSRRLIN